MIRMMLNLSAAAAVSCTAPSLALARQADPATLDLQASLDGVVTMGLEPLLDLARGALEHGADPLAPVEAQGHSDSYAYLIALAEDACEREAQGLGMGHDWRAVTYEVFALMQARGAPPSYARDFLDAAMTPPGQEVVFTGQASGVRAMRDRMAVTAHALQSTAEPDAAGFVRHDWAEAYEGMKRDEG
ncbi:hypothetical protein ACFELO_05405 [Oceanicaulis sp. LC35]|uniref:hypothetical protein n=1 Tax=Oceanicaulis sp. LC35 TaxID=3349635 RepID=UPI003F840ECB